MTDHDHLGRYSARNELESYATESHKIDFQAETQAPWDIQERRRPEFWGVILYFCVDWKLGKNKKKQRQRALTFFPSAEIYNYSCFLIVLFRSS